MIFFFKAYYFYALSMYILLYYHESTLTTEIIDPKINNVYIFLLNELVLQGKTVYLLLVTYESLLVGIYLLLFACYSL